MAAVTRRPPQAMPDRDRSLLTSSRRAASVPLHWLQNETTTLEPTDLGPVLSLAAVAVLVIVFVLVARRL